MTVSAITCAKLASGLLSCDALRHRVAVHGAPTPIASHAGVAHHAAGVTVAIGQLVDLSLRQRRRGVGQVDVNRGKGIDEIEGLAEN